MIVSKPQTRPTMLRAGLAESDRAIGVDRDEQLIEGSSLQRQATSKMSRALRRQVA